MYLFVFCNRIDELLHFEFDLQDGLFFFWNNIEDHFRFYLYNNGIDVFSQSKIVSVVSFLEFFPFYHFKTACLSQLQQTKFQCMLTDALKFKYFEIYSLFVPISPFISL